MTKLRIPAILIALQVLAAAAQGGTLSPALEARIADLDDQDVIKAIIMHDPPR